MRFRKCATVVLCLVLALVAVAVPILVSAYSVDEVDQDYSRPGSSHNLQLNSADILERYLGEQLNSAEYDYLAEHGGVTLTFDKGVNTSYSMLTYNEAERILRVEAFVYSYLAENGTEATAEEAPVEE